MVTSAVDRVKGLGLELFPQPDGSLQIGKRELEQRARRPGSILGAVVWNGVTFLLLAGMNGRLPGQWEVTEGFPGAATWVLGFFALIGLSWIWQLIWTWLGREEWVVSQNRLEVRQHMLGACRRRFYVDSDFQLERVNGDIWHLSTGAGLRRRFLLTGTFTESREVPALFDLADLLGARTGWSVRAPDRPHAGVKLEQAVPDAMPDSLAPEALALPLDPQLSAPAEAELDPGERLLWVGRPDAGRVALQASPALLFGIPWTLFSLNFLRGREWEFSAFSLMPLLFSVFGVCMCCAPGVAYFKALRTTYAITDRRVLILVRGKRRTVESYGANAISGIERKEQPNECGDLVFARRLEKDGDGGQKSVEIKFIGIPRVREVERLLRLVFQA